ENLELVTTEPGTHLPHRHKLAVPVHPRDQRPQVLSFGNPSANNDFMTRSALRLRPTCRTPRAIRRIEPLGDNALELRLACRLQHRHAVGLQVTEVTDVLLGLLRLLTQKRLETLLTFNQLLTAQVLAFNKQQVEDEEYDGSVISLGQRGL